MGVLGKGLTLSSAEPDLGPGFPTLSPGFHCLLTFFPQVGPAASSPPFSVAPESSHLVYLGGGWGWRECGTVAERFWGRPCGMRHGRRVEAGAPSRMESC